MQPPGDHQMQHEEQLALELPHDPLAQPPEILECAFPRRRKVRAYRANYEWAAKVYARSQRDSDRIAAAIRSKSQHQAVRALPEIVMLRRLLATGLIALLAPAVCIAAEAPVWLVVTTPQLAASIQPLAERRRSEGLDAAVVTDDVATALKQHPQRGLFAARGRRAGADETPDPAWHVPSVDDAVLSLAQ